MKYKDLIKFDPIETVIQLRESSKKETAKNLISSYVISDEMADKLINIAFPNLQLDKPSDNKALLIVGNYGTGKSHLMSVISAISEDSTLTDMLTNEKVKKEATKISGRFKVLRMELGSTTKSLRDIIIDELEEFLESIDVKYSFPEIGTITSNKPSFELMMAEFQKKYPQYGLLIVVDELLDYLSTRKDHDLILDLNFLREIGEVCKDLRLRFVAGVQEAIFDSQRFAFISDTLRRVKDRFEQILIVRNDIKYVVTHRLLKKTSEQKTWIREYLVKFTKFYNNMNERIEEFVDLFPIHPDYITTFELVTVAEKREILKTISIAMREILENEVPEEYPCIISYDDYWIRLKSNPSFRSIPEIKAVIDCSQVLESRINQVFTRPQYKPLAIRIIYALSVHRLTMNNIYAPIGATPSELRDSLCLYQPGIEEMGGEPAEDLLTLVETVLKEIHKTVNGQFISSNRENQQYYLDLKKTEDFDAIIEKKANSLDDYTLDKYYFDALKQVMECTDQTYVSGYKIWEHEIEWVSHKVTRQGYLFFGSPNERSTAVPPRDFYIYFIQPFDPPKFKDEKKPDELFIRLVSIDDEFNNQLKNYASANELYLTSSGDPKEIYEKKGRELLFELAKWLKDNVLYAFEITYMGEKRSLIEWIKNKAPIHSQESFRDIINTVGSICFNGHFEDLAPEYPTFSVLITKENRIQAAQDALRFIVGSAKTKQAIAVLDALQLLEGDRLDPSKSIYAQYIVKLLSKKVSIDTVINRSDIFKDVQGIEYFNPKRYRLEPEWVVVLLAALIYSGDLVLNIAGNTFDASNITSMASQDFNDLINFKYIKKPKGWNLPGMKALFELIDAPLGWAEQITIGKDEPVKEFQKKISLLLEDIVLAEKSIQDGLQLCNENLLNDEEKYRLEEKLNQIKDFFENIQKFNTPGKFKNFSYSKDEIAQYMEGLDTLKYIQQLKMVINELLPYTSYLIRAADAVPEDHPLIKKISNARVEIIKGMKDKAKRNESGFVQNTINFLNRVKDEYIKFYLEMHRKARLNKDEDNRKIRLLNDIRIKDLKKLSIIDMLPHQHLTNLLNQLANLKTCFSLTEIELKNNPICPYCAFKPSQEKVDVAVKEILDNLDEKLNSLCDSWTKLLIQNLEDPIVQKGLDLLKLNYKKEIENFLKTRILPDPLTADFIQGVKEALSGLIKVTIPINDLKKALTIGGSPSTPKEMIERFNNYIKTLIEGKNQDKIRLVIE